MVFISDGLKYNTDKMILISEKCRWIYRTKSMLGFYFLSEGRNVKLYHTVKNNWCVVYESEIGYIECTHISEKKAAQLLLDYDLEAYESIFGEIEDA